MAITIHLGPKPISHRRTFEKRRIQLKMRRIRGEALGQPFSDGSNAKEDAHSKVDKQASFEKQASFKKMGNFQRNANIEKKSKGRRKTGSRESGQLENKVIRRSKRLVART